MKSGHDFESVLKLERLVFDKILFERTGFKRDNEIEIQFETRIGEKRDSGLYRVTLTCKGSKPEEYNLEVSVTGFFQIEEGEMLSEELRKSLISTNTVAILMPYVRSEISLLTAQPGVDCIVLPAFNINKMMEE